jgi:hypothetical protein
MISRNLLPTKGLPNQKNTAQAGKKNFLGFVLETHQGREIIAIVALENSAFCTVFSENFHKFLAQLQYSILSSQWMSLLQKKFQTLVQFFNDKKLHIQ